MRGLEDIDGPTEADLAEIEAEVALVDLVSEPDDNTATLVPTDDEYVTWDEDDYRE